jgi:hypothetical protein
MTLIPWYIPQDIKTEISGYDSVMIAFLIPTRRFFISLAFLLLAVPALAKDTPLQVIVWPETGVPAIRFTFGQLKLLDGMKNNKRVYVMDTTAENLSAKPISSSRFSVYLFDKNKVRISEEFINLTSVAPGETVKLQLTITAAGTPIFVSVQEVALGGSGFDSIELRDGSLVTGDLVSISGMDVEIRVGGIIQHLDRNKIKRVMLVQRDLPMPNPSSAAAPKP